MAYYSGIQNEENNEFIKISKICAFMKKNKGHNKGSDICEKDRWFLF